MTVCLVLGAAPPQSDPLAVLKSDAPYKDKADACRQLVIKGGRDAIPVLAPMLLEEKTSHIARNALEPMPYPEAGAALRDALARTEGRLKIGMISSLAIRKDKEAVPAISQLLGSKDDAVAQAAARALGVIATDPALDALNRAVRTPKLPAETMRAIGDGLLDMAEQRAKSGNRAAAVAIYERLIAMKAAPIEVQVAAMRGAVLTHDAQKGAALLRRMVHSSPEEVFNGGLRTAREWPNVDQVTEVLVAALPDLKANRKIEVICLLGERGGDAAGRALTREAVRGGDAERAAALAALTRLGYEPAVSLLARLAWTAKGEVAEAARHGLSFFPGEAGDKALRALLQHEDAQARAAAVAMIGQGGLDKPGAVLLETASKDPDEQVRVAALKALREYAGQAELGGLLKCMLAAHSDTEVRAAEAAIQDLCGAMKRGAVFVVTKAVYGDLAGGKTADVTEKVRRLISHGVPSVQASGSNFGDPAQGVLKQLRVDYQANGAALSGIVNEGQTLPLVATSIPADVTDGFLTALPTANGEAQLALLRILATAGGERALETVTRVARESQGNVRETAVSALCGWPTADVLGTLARLSASDRRLMLGALASAPHRRSLRLVLAQTGDAEVRAEAAQAAVAIAKALSAEAKADDTFFNGHDLTGWTGTSKYWSVKDGAIVGGGDAEIPRNEFLWSKVPVEDFYLAVDVKLTPPGANAGIQFRSKKVDEHGQALGYQADVGEGWWGKLYHEHGRGLLDKNERGKDAVKPGDWNHYEILAVGPAIWTALNGTLCTAFLDVKGETSGRIALQIHSGAPQTVCYRVRKLVHNPKLEIAGKDAQELLKALER
jgi:HEAT repeat protein